MASSASAIKKATLAAIRLHRELDTQNGSARDTGRIDVYETFARLNVPLIFKPLDGLLGAYLSDPAPGVLVTTKRPSSVQRFTAAHELGHLHLGHKPSLDDDSILRRTPFAFRAGDDVQEIEADAFAAAFLLPRWLVDLHCERQEWTDESLHRPGAAYQLALRVGLSFSATCWTLHRYGILDRSAARQMVAIEPKAIKQALLGAVQPENYYGDVWELTERDTDVKVDGGPSDLFVFKLPEHSGAGYLWRFEDLNSNGFILMDDTREAEQDDASIGDHVTRRFVTQSRGRQSGEMRLSEKRPFKSAKPLGTFVLRYDLEGPEAEGWSRAERRYRLEAA